MEDAYFTTAQVAAAIGCNPETVRRWIKAGRLSPVRARGTGREYLMTAEDLRPVLDDLGYDTEAVLEALLPPETAGEEEESGACIMGRLFCLLSTCGAVGQEDLPAVSEQPGRWIGPAIAHAMQGSPARYREIEGGVTRLMASLSESDLSSEPVGEEGQSKFWAGFYRQREEEEQV